MTSFALVACSPQADGGHWKEIGRIPDGPTTVFIEIEPGFEKSRSVYDDAVRGVCLSSLCRVLFFAKGDELPAFGTLREFMEKGGFNQKPTLARWVGNSNSGTGDFHGWDCTRAGIEGAPLNALCGDGIEEGYSSVLTLAGQTGIQRACSWPKTNDMELVDKYISLIGDKERKNQFRKDADNLYGGGNKRPNDITECEYLFHINKHRVSKAREFISSRISQLSGK